jgi:hypothetical protein
MFHWSKYNQLSGSMYLLLPAVMALTLLFSFAENTVCAADKKQTSMQLTFFKGRDGIRTAKVQVKESDANKKLIDVTGVSIGFYVRKNDTVLFLQKVPTDGKGAATLVIAKSIPVDADGKINIIAKIENDAAYADAEIAGSVQDAGIILTTAVADTTRSLSARVTRIDAGGNHVPLKDMDVIFYVKRMFGLMKLGEDATVTTDENGLAGIAFPGKIKGDADGTITLLARVENDENYGTVEAGTVQKWGVPVAMVNNPFPRTLWGIRTPLWMLISFLAAISGIYLTLFYVLYQLYRIKNEPS